MKIAYLAPAPGIPIQGPTGASAHIRDVCFALKKKGADLRVYGVQKSDRRGIYGPDLSAECTGVAGWPSWLSRYRGMREVLSSRRIAKRLLHDISTGWIPDLIWERHTLFSDAGLRVYRKTGIPWLLEVNSPPVFERLQYEDLPALNWAKKWEKRILNSAPYVVAVSTWLTRWLRDELGCKSVLWLPNGTVDVLGDPKRGRVHLGVKSDKPILGFVGSDKPWQNWRQLIPIAAQLNAELALIGPFPQTPGAIVRTAYDPSRLADIVSSFQVGVAPYTPDAPPWFSPLKIALYRGQGVPVAATDLGDCKQAIGAGGGFTQPVGQPLTPSILSCFSLPRRRELRTWESVVDTALEYAGLC